MFFFNLSELVWRQINYKTFYCFFKTILIDTYIIFTRYFPNCNKNNLFDICYKKYCVILGKQTDISLDKLPPSPPSTPSTRYRNDYPTEPDQPDEYSYRPDAQTTRQYDQEYERPTEFSEVPEEPTARPDEPTERLEEPQEKPMEFPKNIEEPTEKLEESTERAETPIDRQEEPIEMPEESTEIFKELTERYEEPINENTKLLEEHVEHTEIYEDNLYTTPTYSDIYKSKETNNYNYDEVSSVRPRVYIPPRPVEELTSTPTYSTYKLPVSNTPQYTAQPKSNFTYTKQEVYKSKFYVDNSIQEVSSKINTSMYYLFDI